MASEKGLYWIALGLVALALNISVTKQHGSFSGVISTIAGNIAERVSGEVQSRLVLGESRAFPGDRSQLAPIRVETQLAIAQSGLNCRRADSARFQAEMARLQAQKAQMTAMRQMRNVVVFPRQEIAIRMPQRVVMDDGSI